MVQVVIGRQWGGSKHHYSGFIELQLQTESLMGVPPDFGGVSTWSLCWRTAFWFAQVRENLGFQGLGKNSLAGPVLTNGANKTALIQNREGHPSLIVLGVDDDTRVTRTPGGMPHTSGAAMIRLLLTM
ncbi:MAG: hypothetical protein ACRCZF_07885, partial [Gemmataceae bacterium]